MCKHNVMKAGVQSLWIPALLTLCFACVGMTDTHFEKKYNTTTIQISLIRANAIQTQCTGLSVREYLRLTSRPKGVIFLPYRQRTAIIAASKVYLGTRDWVRDRFFIS